MPLKVAVMFGRGGALGAHAMKAFWREGLAMPLLPLSEDVSKSPSSGVEIAYRVLELLMHGKMSLTAQEMLLRRPPLDHDAVSGQLDYSPERIHELIELGMAQAQAALDAAVPGPTQEERHGQVQLPRVA
ncbi:MAG TPA: hypothetical protein H9903_15025 [Candidatus Aquabacterium excrementipullorum]|nr:hypothetical protein [Candidatus Aquabacterium excrementipullorum]